MQDLLLAYALVLQVVTFAAWGLDKWKARRNAARIPERTLLLLALLGGSPAAWLGLRVFRHKSSKRAFQWKLALVTPGVLVLVWLWWNGAPG